MSDADAQDESSLDKLSEAFAEAMGRNRSDGRIGKEAGTDPATSRVPTAEPIEDAEPADTCPISPKTIIEAVLFVGHPENEFIPGESLARLVRGVDEAEVEEVVGELNREYEEHGMPWRISVDGSSYLMELRSEFEGLREGFYGRIREARLSQLAVDVLAVVAYNQPVTREEIDNLLNNGLNSGRVINQLVRRELLARHEDADPKGKGRKAFVTTDRFLDFFNLQDIADLPRSEDPE